MFHLSSLDASDVSILADLQDVSGDSGCAWLPARAALLM
jgi:hypothetical protein